MKLTHWLRKEPVAAPTPPEEDLVIGGTPVQLKSNYSGDSEILIAHDGVRGPRGEQNFDDLSYKRAYYIIDAVKKEFEKKNFNASNMSSPLIDSKIASLSIPLYVEHDEKGKTNKRTFDDTKLILQSLARDIKTTDDLDGLIAHQHQTSERGNADNARIQIARDITPALDAAVDWLAQNTPTPLTPAQVDAMRQHVVTMLSGQKNVTT